MSAPRKGDFVVFKTNGWAARLIQFGTRSRWNHAAIYIGDGKIIEAEPSNVQTSDLSRYPAGTYQWSSLLLSEWEREKIVQYAHSRDGSKYGWIDIVALALVSFGIRPKWLDNFAARDDRLVCSQLVSQAYAEAGVPLTTDDPWTVTPGDLAEIIMESK